MNHLKLAVNNQRLYSYHCFSANVRSEAGANLASVSVQFYDAQDQLYCSKILWRGAYRYHLTARLRAEREMRKLMQRDCPEVMMEQNRQFNMSRGK